MKKLNFALVSDCLFSILCAFIAAFAIMRFYVENLALCISLSVAAALSAGIITLLYLLNKRGKLLESTASVKTLERFALSLALSRDEENAKLFADALDGTYYGGNYIKLADGDAAVLFRVNPLCSDDIAALLKQCNDKLRLLICNSLSDDAEKLAQFFGIEICSAGRAHALLKDKGLSKSLKLPEAERPNFFKNLKLKFKRKLCPPLFFSGLTLIAFSFFTFYPAYYVAAGTALMILSALSLVFGQSS